MNEKTGRRLVSAFLRLEMAILMYHHRSKLGHDGVIFKAVGNAFQAAFASAPRALRAAIEGQRALQAAQWKDMGEQHLKGMEWLEQVCVPG